jgi:glycosyltransferase involved in cell wall biosynthesis
MAQRHPEARLELVGDNRMQPQVDLAQLIARSALSAGTPQAAVLAPDRIRARDYASEAELSSLYARASAFAFLSDYEGFALTPLEALAAGIPSALLDTEVAREIYGPAALYVDRPDPDAIASALERLLYDDVERRRILDAAPAQLARYSWRECAQRTLQTLLAAAR